MEKWRKTWREGVAPSLSTKGLEALRHAILHDDPRLIQRNTTRPILPHELTDYPLEGACAIGFCGWFGEPLATCAEVEEFFARVCLEIDQRLGEPAACRWFLNWFDETPREQMRSELLPEVELALGRHR